MSTSATLIFRGRLGSDPQLRTTQTGEPVANFNLAIDQGYREHKTTAWAQHLSKGDMVCVHSERFQVSVWSAQDNSPQGQLEVTARRVEFITTKRGQAANTGAEQDVPF